MVLSRSGRELMVFGGQKKEMRSLEAKVIVQVGVDCRR